MRTTLLSKIKSDVGGEWIDRNKGIFITETNSMVIGPYHELKSFATNLRLNYEAQEALANRKNPARFGRRNSDQIPVGEIVKGGYKKSIKDKAPDGKIDTVIDARLKRQGGDDELESLKKRLMLGQVITGNVFLSDTMKEKFRLTDLYSAAENYFSSITLESHHIVEKSMLADIERNIEDLDNAKAPCVLIKGELHRRLYTPEGAGFRKAWNLKEEKIRTFYHDFYNCHEFTDLKSMAKIIIDEAFGVSTSNIKRIAK